MNIEELSHRQIKDLTVGELLSILQMPASDLVGTPKAPVTPEQEREKHYLHGLGEISKYFGVTKHTIVKWKKSGKYDDAFFQTGRVVIADADRLMELMRRDKRFDRKKR